MLEASALPILGFLSVLQSRPMPTSLSPWPILFSEWHLGRDSLLGELPGLGAELPSQSSRGPASLASCPGSSSSHLSYVGSLCGFDLEAVLRFFNSQSLSRSQNISAGRRKPTCLHHSWALNLQNSKFKARGFLGRLLESELLWAFAESCSQTWREEKSSLIPE